MDLPKEDISVGSFELPALRIELQTEETLLKQVSLMVVGSLFV